MDRTARAPDQVERSPTDTLAGASATARRGRSGRAACPVDGSTHTSSGPSAGPPMYATPSPCRHNALMETHGWESTFGGACGAVMCTSESRPPDVRRATREPSRISTIVVCPRTQSGP